MTLPTISRPDPEGWVSISVEDEVKVNLRFTWRSLYKLQQELGDEFITTSSKALESTDIGSIRLLASVASGISEKKVEELALPIITVRDAVASAWQFAFFGGVLEDDEDKEPSKKGIRKSLIELLKRLLRVS